jgi:hypothetical protein
VAVLVRLAETFVTVAAIGAVAVVSVRLILSALQDYRRKDAEIRKVEAEAEAAEQRALNEALRPLDTSTGLPLRAPPARDVERR